MERTPDQHILDDELLIIRHSGEIPEVALQGSIFFLTSDPQGPATGTAHVIRGGSWGSLPHSCRSSYRIAAKVERSWWIGVRVVIDFN